MNEGHNKINENITKATEVVNKMIQEATKYTTLIHHTDSLTYAEASLISGSLLETLKKLKTDA